MDLGTLLRIIVRRWIVVIPILAATIVSAYQVAKTVEPEYQAKGAVWFVESPNLGEIEANPLATLNRGVNVTAEAIAVIIQNPESRAVIREQGLNASFTVTPRADRPIIDIQTRGATADQALNTLQGVIDQITATLIERQEARDVNPDQFVEIEILLQDSRARALNSARDRSVAVMVILGLLAAATAAVLLDSYLQRRRELAAQSSTRPGEVNGSSSRVEPEPDRQSVDPSAAGTTAADVPPEPVPTGANGGTEAVGSNGNGNHAVDGDDAVEPPNGGEVDADERAAVAPGRGPSGDRPRRWFSRS